MTKEIHTETTASLIRRIFQDQSDALVENELGILVSHFGSFSQSLVAGLSENIESLVISIGDKRMVIKRLFSIVIEGLQNLRIHGELDSTGVQTGFLILASNDDQYKLYLANIVQHEDAENLSKYINSINSYTDFELKKLYASVLSNEFLSEKGGAGLGLITTKMKSGNPLNFELITIDEVMDLFVLQISIDRA